MEKYPKDARRERIKAFKKFAREGYGEIPRMDELTDEQWQLVEPLLPVENTIGRPPANNRRVLNGIFFYIRNSLTWADIPPEYPSYVTLFRRYHEWDEGGVLQEVINALAGHLDEQSGLEFIEALLARRVTARNKDTTLTIYLPSEYDNYWMTPTAALIFMWIITRGIKAYTASYRQQCKELQVDRLFGQVGPRTIRPRFVVVVIGAAPL